MNPAKDLEYPFFIDGEDLVDGEGVDRDIPKDHAFDEDYAVDSVG